MSDLSTPEENAPAEVAPASSQRPPRDLGTRPGFVMTIGSSPGTKRP